MDLREAWNTLGCDPDQVFERIRSAGSRASRAEAAGKELDYARSLARKLLGLHHPDKNPGDEEAAKRFRRVGDALRAIEDGTIKFQDLARQEPVKERDVFIEIFSPRPRED